MLRTSMDLEDSLNEVYLYEQFHEIQEKWWIYYLVLCFRWRCRFSCCTGRRTRWLTRRWAGRCTSGPAARTRPWSFTRGCGTASQQGSQTTTLRWFSRTSYHGSIGTLTRPLLPRAPRLWWRSRCRRSRLKRALGWGIYVAWRVRVCATIHPPSFLYQGRIHIQCVFCFGSTTYQSPKLP